MKENWYKCLKCGLVFPESEFTSITEDEKDICPACGAVDCFTDADFQERSGRECLSSFISVF